MIRFVLPIIGEAVLGGNIRIPRISMLINVVATFEGVLAFQIIVYDQHSTAILLLHATFF